MRSFQLGRRIVVAVALCGAFVAGCKSDPKKSLSVPASSDPEGKDLDKGAIVAAFEKGGGVRIYKIVDIAFFPPPMSDELVMIAYNEKRNDFTEAAGLGQRGKLTVALSQVRVQRHLFRTRDYRIITVEPVTDADRSAKPIDPPAPKK